MGYLVLCSAFQISAVPSPAMLERSLAIGDSLREDYAQTRAELGIRCIILPLPFRGVRGEQRSVLPSISTLLALTRSVLNL